MAPERIRRARIRRTSHSNTNQFIKDRHNHPTDLCLELP
jgi:hypothetical protein